MRRRRFVRRKARVTRSKNKGSQDSDEDYVMGEEAAENSEESSDYSSCLVASEESFDFGVTSCCSSEDESKVDKSKQRKGVSARRKPRVKPSNRKNKAFRVSDEDEDYDTHDEEFVPDGENCVEQEQSRAPSKKKSKSGRPGTRKKMSKKSRKRKRELKVVNKTSKNEGRSISSDAEEFPMPKRVRMRTNNGARSISSDDDFIIEESARPKRVRMTVKNGGRYISSNDEFIVEEKARPKRVRMPVKNKKISVSSDDDFIVKESAGPKRVRKKIKLRKKVVPCLDSDFIGSDSSDFEYSLSEEEREFIREAQKRVNATTCLRNSSGTKGLQADRASNRQLRRHVERKGKEKVEELQVDTEMQMVCGICLSEEWKGNVRGALNCCSHCFCFTCILEWSKVESRCPLCKQRFVTIRKEATSDIVVSLRKTVIRVPRRDQVYQPSEEEMMSYLNPYEIVLCLECQQGGDDELMLLCDICDSSAHTYCVGLGREVPDGNWYCEACNSSGLRTSNSMVPDSVPDQGTGSGELHSKTPVREVDAKGFDLNLPFSTDPVGSLEQSCSRAIDAGSSSRNLVREALEAALPVYGVGASTVLGRRSRIYNFISTNRVSQIPEVPVASSENDIPISEIECARLGEHFAARESDTQNADRLSPLLDDSPSCSVGNRDSFCSGLSYLRREEIQGPATLSSNGTHNEIPDFESQRPLPSYNMQGDGHCMFMSRSKGSLSSCARAGQQNFSLVEEAKEQVRTMVKKHLTLVSRETKIEYKTYKEIARHSTHTILAACGFAHHMSMAICVDPPSNCPHSEESAQRNNLINGVCASCFDCFIRDVVLKLTKNKLHRHLTRKSEPSGNLGLYTTTRGSRRRVIDTTLNWRDREDPLVENPTLLMKL